MTAAHEIAGARGSSCPRVGLPGGGGTARRHTWAVSSGRTCPAAPSLFPVRTWRRPPPPLAGVVVPGRLPSLCRSLPVLGSPRRIIMVNARALPAEGNEVAACSV
jgi:hypothetical protein